jgi:NADPH-dependent glutamate synthase beta subunit-like oxidoreductase
LTGGSSRLGASEFPLSYTEKFIGKRSIRIKVIDALDYFSFGLTGGQRIPASPERRSARAVAAAAQDSQGNEIALDSSGFIKTGADLAADDLDSAGSPLGRRPYLFETSVPGLFAVGDIRSGSVKRVASAVGEGSVVVQLVHRILAG